MENSGSAARKVLRLGHERRQLLLGSLPLRSFTLTDAAILGGHSSAMRRASPGEKLRPPPIAGANAPAMGINPLYSSPDFR